jgi:hypothetical protein
MWLIVTRRIEVERNCNLLLEKKQQNRGLKAAFLRKNAGLVLVVDRPQFAGHEVVGRPRAAARYFAVLELT